MEQKTKNKHRKTSTDGQPPTIFDALSYVPTREVLLDLIVSLPPQMARYLEDVFGPRVAPLIGMSAQELFRLKRTASPQQLRDQLAPKLEGLAVDLDDFVAQLDAMGVDKAVIFNLDEQTPSGLAGLPNDYYADVVQRHPAKFIGFAGIDPLKGDDAVREIHRSYELGLRGIAVRPFMFGLPPHDAKMAPLYAACVELDMPVWFHTGINYSTLTMEVERPVYFDVVAQDFPALKIIAGHGGWPWVAEMMAVAWRNPNVVVDIASIEPKYLAKPGSGWETLMHFGNSLLQDRIVFASTWLLMGKTPRQLADDVMQLPLKPEVQAKWLHHNAARFFDTEP